MSSITRPRTIPWAPWSPAWGATSNRAGAILGAVVGLLVFVGRELPQYFENLQQGLAGIVGVELDDYGFLKTSPLSPVDSTAPGVFVCGCAESPMDVPESVAQASSAAARAAEMAFQSDMEKEKAVA